MSTPVPVADLVAPVELGVGDRHRAWIRAGCVALATLIYLCWWTSYAVNGLSAYGRFDQLDPGEVAVVKGAEFHLTSLVQTDALTNSITGDRVAPAPNIVWLVADIEVTRRSDPDYFYCSFEVLGPDRRTWEDDSLGVSREIENSCDKDSAPIGHTVAVEAVFQIPERYVDQLAGVGVIDDGSRTPEPVMVPAP
jgi:hypothetical protein